MRYLKTYEHLVNDFEDKVIYGEYLADEMELIKGLNGFIAYDFFYKDDYNVANHPDEVQYLFRFKESADLEPVQDYLEENDISYEIFHHKYSTNFSFYIKKEIIEEYVSLLYDTKKYNL